VLRPTSLALIAAGLASAVFAADPETVDSKVWGSGASLQPPTWLRRKAGPVPHQPVLQGQRAAARARDLGGDGKARSTATTSTTTVIATAPSRTRRSIRGQWDWCAGHGVGTSATSGWCARRTRQRPGALRTDPMKLQVCRQEMLQDKVERGAPLRAAREARLPRPARGAGARRAARRAVQFVRATAPRREDAFASREFNVGIAYYESRRLLIRSVLLRREQARRALPWPADKERPLWIAQARRHGSPGRKFPKGPWVRRRPGRLSRPRRVSGWWDRHGEISSTPNI
jgi:hypothetical protein